MSDGLRLGFGIAAYAAGMWLAPELASGEIAMPLIVLTSGGAFWLGYLVGHGAERDRAG